MKTYHEFIKKSDPIIRYLNETIDYNEFKTNYSDYIKEGFNFDSIFSKIINSLKTLKNYIGKNVKNIGNKIINIIKTILSLAKRFFSKSKVIYTTIVIICVLFLTNIALSNTIETFQLNQNTTNTEMTIDGSDGDGIPPLEPNQPPDLSDNLQIIEASIGFINEILKDADKKFPESDLMETLGILTYLRDEISTGKDVSWDDKKINDVSSRVKTMVNKTIELIEQRAIDFKAGNNKIGEYLLKFIETSKSLILTSFDVEGKNKQVTITNPEEDSSRTYTSGLY